jgi:hypothetical protein
MRSATKTCVVLVTLALLLATVPGKAAGEVAPRKPSDIVTVVAGSSGFPCLGSGVKLDLVFFNDGTSRELHIAPGDVLVITGATWSAFHGRANTHHPFWLYRRADATAPIFTLARGAGALSDDTGFVSGSLTLSTGYVIKPGFTICADVRDSQGGVPSSLTVVLNGFFAKDR